MSCKIGSYSSTIHLNQPLSGIYNYKDHHQHQNHKLRNSHIEKLRMANEWIPTKRRVEIHISHQMLFLTWHPCKHHNYPIRFLTIYLSSSPIISTTKPPHFPSFSTLQKLQNSEHLINFQMGIWKIRFLCGKSYRVEELRKKKKKGQVVHAIWVFCFVFADVKEARKRGWRNQETTLNNGWVKIFVNWRFQDMFWGHATPSQQDWNSNPLLFFISSIGHFIFSFLLMFVILPFYN